MVQENTAQKISVGDAARSKVPMSHRLSFANNIFLFAGWVMVLSSLFVGGAVGLKFPLKDAIPIIFFGTMANAIIGMMIASIGARSGYSAALIHRFVYGKAGVVLPNTIMAIAGIGWASVILNITRDALLNVIMPNGAPFWVKFFFTLLFIILFALPAYLGVKSLAFVARIAVPGYFLVFIAVLVLVLKDAGGFAAIYAKSYGGNVSVYAGLDAAAGGWLVGCTFISNLARFWKNSRHAAIGALISFAVIVTFQYIGGAIGAAHTGEYDIFKIAALMFGGVFGILAWLALYLGAQSTIQGGIYASGLAFSAPPIPMVKNQEYTRRLYTFILAVIIFIACFLGVDKYVFSFSRFLAAIIAPLAMTVMLDYWVFPERRRLYESTKGPDMKINPAAFTACIVGSIAGLYMGKTQLFSGFLTGLAVSGLIYYVWMKYALSRGKNSEQLLVACWKKIT